MLRIPLLPSTRRHSMAGITRSAATPANRITESLPHYIGGITFYADGSGYARMAVGVRCSQVNEPVLGPASRWTTVMANAHTRAIARGMSRSITLRGNHMSAGGRKSYILYDFDPAVK